ncbi:MAG: hypothetical protein IAF00_03640, partial [Phycisphaerales bacterium]|nr:hypothetical protein [Phycisphaerales bacterium]
AWRKTLCRQGVIRCEGGRGQRNRFWNEDDDNGDNYAPPPPRQGRDEQWR